MIEKIDDRFPVPVSGKPIQRGWFGALVRFVNSLRLRGDGRYFMVSRNLGGTTIQPSPALLQAIDHSGGAAPSAGGSGTTYGIEATIDGSTASVALVEGGTASSISLVPTAPVTLTAGANGELIIGATVSGGGGFGPPDFSGGGVSVSDSTDIPVNTNSWLWGDVGISPSGERWIPAGVTLGITISGHSVSHHLIYDGGLYATSNLNASFNVGVCEAIPAGATVNVNTFGSGVMSLKLYPSL